MDHRVPTDPAGRSRRGRALLAGGAVLGLGAVATLAAWSDDVRVVSSFITTPFSIEAAVAPKEDSGWENPDWQEYGEPNGGELQFQVDPSAMTPGELVYAPLYLRLSNGETEATISVASAPSNIGLSGNSLNFYDMLKLTLHRNVNPANCSSGDTGGGDGEPVPDFQDVSLSTTGPDIVSLPGDGTPVGLCFEVELLLDAGLSERNGSTGQMVWTFHAEPETVGP